ncbi:hypothetical protein TREMEDRAFT_61200 [Tremella mesenterica DSM 1558]|uniref:uncharacterized protein n=1 Tax=Tremella mesenterica (strain ATCC 24925 / CBS 8224 / DSM 1558 / NBRC 9311 / NRRL Y-6157 / RJB 2259-6 / UBC 559-6) TaxID=578456 RepID=UPI0003F48D61|nr:uncharacterized protein TREMEDRAFT_61200 [Tremella mesenterica DSM 1558]EIW70690.1 hypothetical protein TREMEDRAFT_61200 [Tremella mesenterica DSM 1558]
MSNPSTNSLPQDAFTPQFEHAFVNWVKNENFAYTFTDEDIEARRWVLKHDGASPPHFQAPHNSWLTKVRKQHRLGENGEEVLYRPSPEGDQWYKLVPISQVLTVIKRVHCLQTAHSGQNKTHEEIARYYRGVGKKEVVKAIKSKFLYMEQDVLNLSELATRILVKSNPSRPAFPLSVSKSILLICAQWSVKSEQKQCAGYAILRTILQSIHRCTAKLDGVRLSRNNGSRSTAKLDGVRLSRDNGSRSTAKLDGVRLSRDNGSRSAAMLGGVSRRRKRMAEGSGKLDELFDSRDSIKDRSYRRPVRTSEKYEDIMEPERRVTRGMSRDGDRMEENERRALEELSRAMGQDLGVEDSVGGSIQGDEFVPPVPSNPPSPPSNALPPAGSPLGSDQTPRPRENTGSTANLGEEGTQGVVLALMQMVANMNKDMMEERRRREEWEQRRERDTKEEKKWEKGQPSAQGGVQAAMMSTVVKSTPPNIDEVRRRWPRPSSDLRETRRKEGKCTECGEAGHWLKECPVREAKVKVGLLPPWGGKFGERGGGSGGNAVPLGQRRNLNAVGGEVDLEEDQGKEEDLSQ